MLTKLSNGYTHTKINTSVRTIKQDALHCQINAPELEFLTNFQHQSKKGISKKKKTLYTECEKSPHRDPRHPLVDFVEKMVIYPLITCELRPKK